MARLQLMPLLADEGDPNPFVFVLDQADKTDPESYSNVHEFAAACGARSVLITTDTVEVV